MRRDISPILKPLVTTSVMGFFALVSVEVLLMDRRGCVPIRPAIFFLIQFPLSLYAIGVLLQGLGARKRMNRFTECMTASSLALAVVGLVATAALAFAR